MSRLACFAMLALSSDRRYRPSTTTNGAFESDDSAISSGLRTSRKTTPFFFCPSTTFLNVSLFTIPNVAFRKPYVASIIPKRLVAEVFVVIGFIGTGTTKAVTAEFDIAINVSANIVIFFVPERLIGLSFLGCVNVAGFMSSSFAVGFSILWNKFL
jgi:hypothetical protein